MSHHLGMAKRRPQWFGSPHHILEGVKDVVLSVERGLQKAWAGRANGLDIMSATASIFRKTPSEIQQDTKCAVAALTRVCLENDRLNNVPARGPVKSILDAPSKRPAEKDPPKKPTEPLVIFHRLTSRLL